MEIVVEALYNPPLIGHHTYIRDETDLRSTIMRRVVDLENEVIRQQLIKMGWTPPKESK